MNWRSAMLEKPRTLFAWLGRRVFDHLKLAPEMETRLRDLSKEGQVVYIMRTRSTLDYLFFNYLYLKLTLPLARFANGINLSFYRGLRVWIGDLWRRIIPTGARVPPAEQFEWTIRDKHPALLFLKVRGLTAERQTQPHFIEQLVAAQRESDHPLLLVPQLILWPRKPPSTRRSWFDIAFGDQEASGKLRKIGHFLRFRKNASVQVGEPINLQTVLDEHAGWSDKRLARMVRRVLLMHLSREAMAVRGPAVKPPATIRREILESKRFRRALRTEADRAGITEDEAIDRARKQLHEIAAKTVFDVLIIFGWFLDWVFNKVFQGVEVDEVGMRRVKQAAKLSRTAPVILVPSHKSHTDYLVMSWVFMRNEFIPPHVAAGANLSFFPVGPILRRSGAFFLRRSFANAPIYKLVFRFYLWKLVQEGYPIEFYLEGGRSRTGKLLPPKLGMLSMLLEGIRQGAYTDLQFVPINLSYEQVIETSTYHRELTGEQKKAESVGQVVKARKILRTRYGRVYVSFEEPIRLTDWLKNRGIDDLAETDEGTFRGATRGLAYYIMRQIQEATVVSPSHLVGLALLSHERRGISGPRLRAQIGFIIDFLTRRNARMSHSIQAQLEHHADTIAKADAVSPRDGFQARGVALRPLIDKAIGQLRKLVDRTERDDIVIYTVSDKARLELDYYRNSILGILAPDAMLATVLQAAEVPLRKNQLAHQVKRLSDWFRLEFIYPCGRSFEQNFEDTLARMETDALLIVQDDGVVRPTAPHTLDFLRSTILHLVEGYWVAADALRLLSGGPVERKEWLEHAREVAEREYQEGELRRVEAASNAVLGNALSLFVDEGLVQTSTHGTGRKPMVLFELNKKVTLEDLAFRRDDMGLYLTRASQES